MNEDVFHMLRKILKESSKKEELYQKNKKAIFNEINNLMI